MARKHEICWYRAQKEVARAAFYHCRDGDLRAGSGISKGTIVQGIYLRFCGR